MVQCTGGRISEAEQQVSGSAGQKLTHGLVEEIGQGKSERFRLFNDIFF